MALIYIYIRESFAEADTIDACEAGKRFYEIKKKINESFNNNFHSSIVPDNKLKKFGIPYIPKKKQNLKNVPLTLQDTVLLNCKLLNSMVFDGIFR